MARRMRRSWRKRIRGFRPFGRQWYNSYNHRRHGDLDRYMKRRNRQTIAGMSLTTIALLYGGYLLLKGRNQASDGA